jgi:hypothetical protein
MTKYPYEKRPRLVDRLIMWRHTRNQHIIRAPLIILTGAGASAPLGVPTLSLPAKIKLASEMEIETKNFMPEDSSFTEQLDLESLMIIVSVMKNLPRQIVHHSIGNKPEDKERHLDVLVATLRMAMPKIGGQPFLSYNFVKAVAKRIIDLDIARQGKFLDHIYDAIKELIINGCLQLRKENIVPTYGPLLKRLAGLLSQTNNARHGLTVPIFTTNYDETFEFMSGEFVARISDEISADFAVFNSTESNPGYPHWRTFLPSGYARYKPQTRNSLNLVIYYLHGSVAWSFTEEAKPDFTVFVADAIAARQTKYYRALLPPDGQKVLYGKSHQGISDLFAPERKDPFRPGAIYYPMRLGYLFLEKCLRHARVILAIGYSFRDSDCHELLLKVWEIGNAPKVLLLDPTPEPILARLAHSPNVIPIRGKFGEAHVYDAVEKEIARHLNPECKTSVLPY